MPRALLACERGEEAGRAVGTDEGKRRGQGRGLDVPRVLATEDPRCHVMHGVSDVGAREAGLDVAQGAVVEHRTRDLDRRRGMGQVVRDHLVVVDVAEPRRAPLDHLAGELDRSRGRLQVRFGHGVRLLRPAGDDGYERRQHDRVVAGIDAR